MPTNFAPTRLDSVPCVCRGSIPSSLGWDGHIIRVCPAPDLVFSQAFLRNGGQTLSANVASRCTYARRVTSWNGHFKRLSCSHVQHRTSRCLYHDQRTKAPREQKMTWETEIPGLPDEFIFQSLVKVANEHLESDAVTLYDHRTNSNTNCADLLADILGLQKAVLNILTPEARSALRAGQGVFILIVAPLGYEWIVGYLTVFSLGAVVACICEFNVSINRAQRDAHRWKDASIVLISTIADDLPGPEIARFIEDTKASAVLLASHARVTRQSLSDLATCPALNIQQSLPPRPLSRTEQFTVNPAHRPDPKSIGTVMFTSGSTSRPKGVLHSRETNNKRVSDVLDAKLIANLASLMTSAPGSGATGSLYSLAYIVLGGIVHFPPAVWTPRWAWELIRTGTVSSLVDFPNVYQELIEFYWENLAFLPPAEKDAYLGGLRSLVYAGVIGSTVPEPMRQRWLAIPNAPRLINTYAATEVGHICLTIPTDEDFSNVSKPRLSSNDLNPRKCT